jgi:hypothetical protein
MAAGANISSLASSVRHGENGASSRDGSNRGAASRPEPHSDGHEIADMIGKLIVHLVIQWILRFIPEPIVDILMSAALGAMAVFVLSFGLTTWKTRRILSRSLGRPVRHNEETSLKAWMALSAEELDAGVRELGQEPSEMRREFDSTNGR